MKKLVIIVMLLFVGCGKYIVLNEDQVAEMFGLEDAQNAVVGAQEKILADLLEDIEELANDGTIRTRIDNEDYTEYHFIALKQLGYRIQKINGRSYRYIYWE